MAASTSKTKKETAGIAFISKEKLKRMTTMEEATAG